MATHKPKTVKKKQFVRERCEYFKDGDIRCTLHKFGQQYCKAHEIVMKDKKLIIQCRTCPICTNDVEKMRWFGCCNNGCCPDCISHLTSLKCPFCTEGKITPYISKMELRAIIKNENNKKLETQREQSIANHQLINRLSSVVQPLMLSRYARQDNDDSSSGEEISRPINQRRRNNNNNRRENNNRSMQRVVDNIDSLISTIYPSDNNTQDLMRGVMSIALARFY